VETVIYMAFLDGRSNHPNRRYNVFAALPGLEARVASLENQNSHLSTRIEEICTSDSPFGRHLRNAIIKYSESANGPTAKPQNQFEQDRNEMMARFDKLEEQMNVVIGLLKK
jgi:hypothetical protein